MPKLNIVSIPVDHVPIMLKLVENVFNMVLRKKLNYVKLMDVVIELGMEVFVVDMGLLMLDGVVVVVLVQVKNVAAARIMIMMISAAAVHQQRNENEEIVQQKIVPINPTLEEYVVNMVQK